MEPIKNNQNSWSTQVFEGKKTDAYNHLSEAFEESLSTSIQNDKHINVQSAAFSRDIYLTTEKTFSDNEAKEPLLSKNNKVQSDKTTTVLPPVTEKTMLPAVSGPSKYADIVSEMSDKYNVPEKLIYSVIKTESGFNEKAVSPSGATGLMQLMPKTASWLGVKDAFDPKQNIEGGVKYLSMMMDKYDGDLRLSLAAYNAGPGNVDKYGGVPPFKETQNYIKKILG